MGTQTAPLFFYHPFCLIKLAFYIVWVIWIVCRVSAVYMVYVFGNLDNLHGFGGLSSLVIFGNVGNLYGLGSLGTAPAPHGLSEQPLGRDKPPLAWNLAVVSSFSLSTILASFRNILPQWQGAVRRTAGRVRLFMRGFGLRCRRPPVCHCHESGN